MKVSAFVFAALLFEVILALPARAADPTEVLIRKAP